MRSNAAKRSSLPNTLSPGHLRRSSSNSGKLSLIQRTEGFLERLAKGRTAKVRVAANRSILRQNANARQIRGFFMGGSTEQHRRTAHWGQAIIAKRYGSKKKTSNPVRTREFHILGTFCVESSFFTVEKCRRRSIISSIPRG